MNEELVRISQRRYDEIVKIGRGIDQLPTETLEELKIPEFTDKRNYPSAEDLESFGAPQKVRDWLPYLIFYRDVFQPEEGEEEEFGKTRDYIDELLNEWLDVIPDEAFSKIDKLTAAGWAKLDAQERCDCFRELMEYYNPNEYNSFIKDLGWKNFMGAYDIHDRKNYAMAEDLVDDLKKIWEEVQSEPL